MSSDESDFECDESLGQQVYQWEPEYTVEELITIENQSINDTDHVENPRSFNLDWCKCNNCSLMPSLKDYTENYLSDVIICITQHPDFEVVCLNVAVLETAFVSFLLYKRQSGRAPDSLSPKQSRLVAYRQFVSWIRRGQPLGKQFRIVLPSCVVNKIRKVFPDPNGTYEGFHYASTSDSNSE